MPKRRVRKSKNHAIETSATADINGRWQIDQSGENGQQSMQNSQHVKRRKDIGQRTLY